MARLGDRVTTRAREVRRADPTTLEEFGALIARNLGVATNTGVAITNRRALAISAWYSGVRYLAEGVAFLPSHTFRRSGPIARPRHLREADRPWKVRPDVETPWESWVEYQMYSLLHRGNGFSLKLRDGSERVDGLRSIDPDLVRYGTASDSTKVFAVRDAVTREEIPLTTREVFHVPGLSIGGGFGLNPIQFHAQTLGIVAAGDEAAGAYYGNASHPAGVIEVPQEMEEDEADRLKAEWDRFHRGLKNRERIGVLSSGARYNPISIKAEDAQLLEARKFGVTEVARLLRIPPHKLYDLEHATYTNIEHQSIEAVMDSIRPWCERLETHLNFDRDLLPGGGLFVEFQLEGLLRGDTAARFEGYSKALGGHPWMKVNEPRRLENLPEDPDLDFVPAPVNMGKVGDPPPAPSEGDAG